MTSNQSEEDSSQEGGDEMSTATAEATATTEWLVKQTSLLTPGSRSIKTGQCPVCGQDVTSGTDQMMAKLEADAAEWSKAHGNALVSRKDMEGALYGFMRVCHGERDVAIRHIPVPTSQPTRKTPSSGEIPAYKPGSDRFQGIQGY